MFARSMLTGLAFLLLPAACSSAPVADGTNTQQSKPSSESGRVLVEGECCISGEFYRCNSQASWDRCAGFDLSACMARCPVSDGECMSACGDAALAAKHDPSLCVRESSSDSVCGAGPSDPTDPTDPTDPSDPKPVCKGTGTSPPGAGCSVNAQCCSMNCTEGTCQTNSYGAKCSLNAQCDSGNCTLGRCQNKTAGSPCSLNAQCNSNNCTGGKCQL